MSKIKLRGDRWETIRENDVHVNLSGHIIIDGKFIESPKTLLVYLNSKKDISEFSKDDYHALLNELWGNYAIIIQSKETLFAAVDISRTYPLFYSGNNFRNLKITDCITIEQLRNSGIDDKKLSEFLAFGIISGKETLAGDIYQLQAGEYLYATHQLVTESQYFNYLPSKVRRDSSNIEDFVYEFDKLLSNEFTRLTKSYPDDTNWVVPLSGGHDSRLIINYLHKTGVKNVTCFTYGRHGNKESDISKQVAESVGYDWHFVHYTEEKWNTLHNENIIDDYLKFTFNGVSNPHFQDLLAVYELKRKNIAYDNSVFLPGHSSITENGFSVKEISDTFDSSFFDKYLGNYSMAFTKPIKEKLTDIYSSFEGDVNYINANFNWRESQAKYIINSCRVYEFFGFQFALPFWYKNIAAFWLTLSDEDLHKRNLLFSAEKHGLLIPALNAIPFANDLNNKSKGGLNFKKTIRKLLPKKSLNYLLKKGNWKSESAEALNLVFAKRGKNIGEILSPLDDFPIEIRNEIETLLGRRPYQLSVYEMSKLYTLKQILAS